MVMMMVINNKWLLCLCIHTPTLTPTHTHTYTFTHFYLTSGIMELLHFLLLHYFGLNVCLLKKNKKYHKKKHH